jgi:hypothetical protein
MDMCNIPGVETPGYCRVVPLGRQIADDEAASGTPERFTFRQCANVAQAFGHDAAGGGRNINAYCSNAAGSLI